MFGSWRKRVLLFPDWQLVDEPGFPDRQLVKVSLAALIGS